VKTINAAAELLAAIRDEDGVIAVTTLFSGMFAIALPGQRFSFRDPLVRADPQAFIPALRPGVNPITALRCIAPIDVQANPPAPRWHTRRLVWPGELLDPSDELVANFHDRFVENRS
jgi:hypothetical protein